MGEHTVPLPRKVLGGWVKRRTKHEGVFYVTKVNAVNPVGSDASSERIRFKNRSDCRYSRAHEKQTKTATMCLVVTVAIITPNHET